MDSKYSFRNPAFWLFLAAALLVSLMLGAAVWNKAGPWRALTALVIPATFTFWWWNKSGSEMAVNLSFAGIAATLLGQLWVLFQKEPFRVSSLALAALFI